MMRSAQGSLALAPLPQAEILAPLDDETLDTPDLLAGDVPEGINPTEAIQAASAPVSGTPAITESQPTTHSYCTPQSCPA